jgi:hypothetical protein
MMMTTTPAPNASLLDAPLGAYDLTKAAPIVPREVPASLNPHIMGAPQASNEMSNNPSPEGQTSDGIALEAKHVVEARKFWLRFKANGGPGVDANGLALVLQNTAAAAAVEFNEKLLAADRNTTALNARLIELQTELNEVQASLDASDVKHNIRAIPLEPPKKRGRKPKAPPVIAQAEQKQSVEDIIAGAL